MKKLLFLILILFAGLLVYVMFFTRDAMQPSGTLSSVIFPPLLVYLFFGVILFFIVKKGYDFMLFR
jgi:hypothetical protein